MQGRLAAWFGTVLGVLVVNACAVAATAVPGASSNTVESTLKTTTISTAAAPIPSPYPTAAPTPWPLLDPTPARCASYSYSTGAIAPWPPVDLNDLSSLARFDQCALRAPRNADALRPSGGPYLSRSEIEQRVLSSFPSGVHPTKVRAYLTTHAGALRLTGGDGEDPAAYPDREVWLVVTQGPGCAVPSGMPRAGGVTLVAPRYCFGTIDATTGQSYGGGSGPPNAADWPPFLPID
jgi:hypothetical protein